MVMSGPGGCIILPLFSLKGPGTNIVSDMNGGEVDAASYNAFLPPSSTFTWRSDRGVAAVNHTFVTSTTVVGTQSGSAAASGGAPASKPSSEDIVGSQVVPFRGTLTAVVAPSGALTLQFNGKRPARLKPGSYHIAVADESPRTGLKLVEPAGKAVILTAAPFVGRRTATVELTPGRWSLTPGWPPERPPSSSATRSRAAVPRPCRPAGSRSTPEGVKVATATRLRGLLVTATAVLAGVLLAAPTAGARQTANLSLNVTFFTNGQITMALPDGTPVGTTSGAPTMIPAGYYALMMNGPGGCTSLPHFILKGPGENVVDNLTEGEVTNFQYNAYFLPNSTYTWRNDANPGVGLHVRDDERCPRVAAARSARLQGALGLQPRLGTVAGRAGLRTSRRRAARSQPWSAPPVRSASPSGGRRRDR